MTEVSGLIPQMIPFLRVKDYMYSASTSNQLKTEGQPSSHGAHSYNSPAGMETSTSPWILGHTME